MGSGLNQWGQNLKNMQDPVKRVQQQINAGMTPSEEDMQLAETQMQTQVGNMKRIAPGMQELSNMQRQIKEGMPMRPEFNNLIDPETGQMQSPYQLNTAVNQQGLDKFREEALRDGPSKWAQMQEAQQTDQIAKQSSAAQAQQANRMAMRGGLSGGAGERMAAAQNAQTMGAQQRARQGIRGQDEQKRMGAMQALPGMELQQATFDRGTDQYNIDKALQEHMFERADNVNAYNEQMRAWASEKTAEATPSSGGGKK